MKFAYFGVPHMGGTYTVYRYLRDGLKSYDINVRWVGLGPKAFEVASDLKWAHEQIYGKVVGTDCETDAELAKALISYVADEGFDGVFINVLADRVQTNIARYLPAQILRVMIVHNITLATYAAATAIRDYVHVTVGVSPRICGDLIKQKGFSAERCQTIPNGIDLTPFSCNRIPQENGPLRLIFLGRVEDTAKGVFWLPKILDLLEGVDYLLTVAGDGPDLEKLKICCLPFRERVSFIGKIVSPAIPALLAGQDVMIFPSRFEGLGLTLVEAQAAGCVPVASRIRGVTDYVVKDGETGFLFPIGDCRQAAMQVRCLAANRDTLQQMSTQARKYADEKFSLGDMAKQYAKSLAVASHLKLLKKPLPIDEWSMPRGMQAGFRTILPLPVKNFLRMAKERFGL